MKLSLDRWFSRHPVMAERACMALCQVTASHLPAGVRWLDWVQGTRVDAPAYETAWKAFRAKHPGGPWGADDGVQPPRRQDFLLPSWSRQPPLPSFRLVFGDDAKAWPSNTCPVCLCRTYDQGDWRDTAGAPRWNKHWHAPCQHTHGVWRDARFWAGHLAERQGGRCPITGEAILVRWGGARDPERLVVPAHVQVDHVKPLWRVRHEADQHAWPGVLRFWGLSNLQALSGNGHKIKTRQEARERAKLYGGNADLGLALPLDPPPPGQETRP